MAVSHFVFTHVEPYNGVGTGRGCQLLPFSAVYWSVTISEQMPADI